MTILLFHIISARPSTQPRMVGSILGVYSFGLTKDIIIIIIRALTFKKVSVPVCESTVYIYSHSAV